MFRVHSLDQIKTGRIGSLTAVLAAHTGSVDLRLSPLRTHTSCAGHVNMLTITMVFRATL